MTMTPSSGWITMFGKTKHVKTTIYNIELNTPEPEIIWIERVEDYYGIPKNKTSIVLERSNWLNGKEINEQNYF